VPSAESVAPLRPSPSSSSELRDLTPPLPSNTNLNEVPVLKLTSEGRMILDAEDLGDADPAGLVSVHKIDSLSAALKRRRDEWHVAHPGDSFPGTLIVDADEHVAAATVKSVFQTAAFAGFSNVSFVVHKAR
jgi:biopolymer transport protein ExbD